MKKPYMVKMKKQESFNSYFRFIREFGAPGRQGNWMFTDKEVIYIKLKYGDYLEIREDVSQ